MVDWAWLYMQLSRGGGSSVLHHFCALRAPAISERTRVAERPNVRRVKSDHPIPQLSLTCFPFDERWLIRGLVTRRRSRVVCLVGSRQPRLTKVALEKRT